jgi:hypothetical protein
VHFAARVQVVERRIESCCGMVESATGTAKQKQNREKRKQGRSENFFSYFSLFINNIL